MSKPSVPQPAAPQQVAGAQTQSNVDTAIANATLGNVNQVGPLSSTTYNQTGGQTVDGNFIPSYTETTQLNPTLQDVLTGTENTAKSLVPTGQAIAGNIQPNGANNNIIQAGPQTLLPQVTNQVYQGEAALLDPTFTQQQTDLTDQLARHGIPIGSQAYSNAETQLGTQQNQARVAAAGNAAQTGVGAASNMFGLALQGAQAPIQQLAQLYGSGAVA